MAFEHELTVRFYEIDRAGIAFFGRFFEYCHAAFEEMLAAAFGDPEAWFVRGGYGMPLVHAEADFAAPVRLGERLRIALEVERLGDTSVTFAYQVTGPDGRPRARCRLVHAFIDLRAFTPRPVPDEFITGLRRLGILEREPRGAT